MADELQSGQSGAPSTGGGAPTPDPGAAQPSAPREQHQPSGPQDQSAAVSRRINEIQQRHQQEVAALRAQIEEGANGNKAFQQRLVDAIQGKQGGEDPETVALRNQIVELLGPKAKLLFDRADEVLGIADSKDELIAGSKHYFQQLGATALRDVDKAMMGVFGHSKPEEFPQQERAAWREHFITWAEQLPNGAARYVRADPSLITDFAAYVESRYVGPARRRATITEESRLTRGARTPQGGGAAGASTQLHAPPKLGDSIEERAKAAFAVMRAQQ